MADNSNVNKKELQNLGSKFSISNFLTDLPRMLNDAFGTVVKYILNFYDPDNHNIGTGTKGSINKISATYIDATTVVAQNLRFKGKNGQVYNFEDIGDMLVELENRISQTTFISKKQIDSLDLNPVQGWPLYADYYNSHPSNPEEGCVVLVSGGIDVWERFCEIDEETGETVEKYEWTTHDVVDQTIYVCGDGEMTLYQYQAMNEYWKVIGKYSDMK